MSPAAQHTCPKCGTAFSRERTLEGHIAARHSRRALAMRGLKWGVAGALLALLGVGAYLLATAPAPPPAGLNLAGEPKLGNDSAPVLFVLLEDPDCPFCKRFHDTTFDALRRAYVDTGKVQLYYKENTGGNPWSFEGAVAQKCAYRLGGDGAFWNFTSRFYHDQGDINAAPGAPKDRVRPFALGYARDEGLDAAAYQRCYDQQETAGQVASDYADAHALGARGTPGFIVRPRSGGQPVLISGAQPLDVFEQNINRALRQAGA